MNDSPNDPDRVDPALIAGNRVQLADHRRDRTSSGRWPTASAPSR